MDKERFSTLLKDPSKVTDSDIKSLNEYRKKYPYFQSLYVVVAKALKDREHPKTEAFIKKAAIYSANRPYLKQIIEGDYTFIEKEIPKVASPSTSKPDVAETSTKEKIEKERSTPPKTVTPAKEEVEVEKTKKQPEPTTPVNTQKEEAKPPIKSPEVKEVAKTTEQAEVDKTVDNKKEEAKDIPKKVFIEEPREVERDIKEIAEAKRRIEALLAGTPIEEETKQSSTKPKGKKKNQIEIIEKFIQNEPQLDRIKLADVEGANNMVDLASKSLKGHEAFETETLAQLMLKQGKRKRAIDIYEKLSLKFPEKRTYFASQIQKIKSE